MPGRDEPPHSAVQYYLASRFALEQREAPLNTLLSIARAIDAISERIGRWVYWLIPLSVLVGVWNVVGRYLGRAVGVNLSSNALIEIQWYLFALVFLLGAAYALKHDDHVRVDVFYSNWSPKRRALVDLIATLLFLIPFSAVIIRYSWNTILSSWRILEMSPDPNGLPRYPIKTAIIIGFLLLIAQGVSEAIKKFAILTGHLAPEEEVRDARF